MSIEVLNSAAFAKISTDCDDKAWVKLEVSRKASLYQEYATLCQEQNVFPDSQAIFDVIQGWGDFFNEEFLRQNQPQLSLVERYTLGKKFYNSEYRGKEGGEKSFVT